MASLFDTVADAANDAEAPPDLDSLFDSLSTPEDAEQAQNNNFDSMPQLINDTKEDIIEDEPYVYEDPNDTKRTISMTVLFLVLMVVYLGFCFYYRKVKVRQSVSDYDESEHRREQRRRENQVSCLCVYSITLFDIFIYSYARKGDLVIYVMCISADSAYCLILYTHTNLNTIKQEVLDESTSASTRARQSAEEQAKLEKRKINIKKALLLRLIVDDDDDDEKKKGEVENEKNEEEKKSVCDTNCECENCQYWKWENPTPVTDSGDSAADSAIARELKKKDVVGEVPPAIKRGIVTIQEEGSDDEDLLASIAKADATMKGHIDIEAQIMDGNAPSSPSLAPLEPPLSPRSSSQGSPEITTQPSPLSSPPRMSLPSPRKYTDALNCGSSRSGRSYTDALNCGGNAVRSAGCGNSTNKLSCSIHGSKNNSTSNTGTDGSDTPTISLPEIVSMYGEECNICLSHFQVGDRVGTNRHHDERSSFSGSDEMANSESEGVGSRCIHAFHEECISRWLLVRDGCPICRRSYFVASTESTGDNVDLESGTVSSNSNLGTIAE